MVASESWVYAQQSILGSMLIETKVVPMVMQETSELDFSLPCLTVYQAIRKLFLNGKAVDPVTVLAVVGAEYRQFLTELMEITPTAANAAQYITICRTEARVHHIRELGQQMAEEGSIEKLSRLLETAAGRLAQKPGKKAVTMQECLTDFMGRHSGEAPRYLNWPWKKLDKNIYSEPGDFIIVGAEPSIGKTAFAAQCAWHFAKSYKVGFFSLETNYRKLFDRMMAGAMEIDMGDLKRNQLNHGDWDRICGRTEDVLERGLEIIPASGWSAADIRAETLSRGYEIIFIDYIQLVQGPGKDRPSIVANVSMAMHTLAQGLNVTVIALSQLTLDDRRRDDPGLDDLRESRQLKQDADVVLMLSLEDQEDRDGPRRLTVRKNKEGTLGKVKLYFDGPRQTFSLEPRNEPPKKTKKQLAAEPVAGQMEMLPPDTPVPF